MPNYFKGVAIRPGKPVLFAKFKNKEKSFFGLPALNSLGAAFCILHKLKNDRILD